MSRFGLKTSMDLQHFVLYDNENKFLFKTKKRETARQPKVSFDIAVGGLHNRVMVSQIVYGPRESLADMKTVRHFRIQV